MNEEHRNGLTYFCSLGLVAIFDISTLQKGVIELQKKKLLLAQGNQDAATIADSAKAYILSSPVQGADKAPGDPAAEMKLSRDSGGPEKTIPASGPNTQSKETSAPPAVMHSQAGSAAANAAAHAPDAASTARANATVVTVDQPSVDPKPKVVSGL